MEIKSSRSFFYTGNSSTSRACLTVQSHKLSRTRISSASPHSFSYARAKSISDLGQIAFNLEPCLSFSFCVVSRAGHSFLPSPSAHTPRGLKRDSDFDTRARSPCRRRRIVFVLEARRATPLYSSLLEKGLDFKYARGIYSMISGCMCVWVAHDECSHVTRASRGFFSAARMMLAESECELPFHVNTPGISASASTFLALLFAEGRGDFDSRFFLIFYPVIWPWQRESELERERYLVLLFYRALAAVFSFFLGRKTLLTYGMYTVNMTNCRRLFCNF